MTYALVTDNTIRSIGPLPKVAQRLDDGTWRKLADDTTEQQRCGYHEVVDIPRPDDTTTTTHDYSVELVDGTPTVVWTPRPKTADELSAETEQANDATLRQQARSSIDTLRTSIDSLKAITDKANSDIGPRDTKDVARETRRVARQVLALSRLMLGALDNIDTGTE